VAALDEPRVRNQLASQGFDIVAGTPAQFEALQKGECARWKRVIEAAGVSGE